MCRHVGLLIVEIIEADELHKQDVFGKADPLVSVWTQGTRKETTVRPSFFFSVLAMLS